MSKSDAYFEITFGAEYGPESNAEAMNAMREFEKSSCHSVAVDLSLLKIMRSNQIGILAKAAKISNERGGKAILFVPNDMLVSILKAVHFDKKTTLIQDKAEFEKVLATLGEIKPEPQPAQAVAPPASPEKASVGQPAARTPIPAMNVVLGGIAAVAVLVAVFLFVVLGVTSQSAKKNRAAYLITTCGLLQKIDSLKTALERITAEEQLMKELESETKSQTKSVPKSETKKDSHGK